MSENFKAKALKILGAIIVVVGFIASFILGDVFKAETVTTYSYLSSFNVSYEYNWKLAIGGIVSSILVGTFFIALSEIIDLLQANYDIQNDIWQELTFGKHEQKDGV